MNREAAVEPTGSRLPLLASGLALGIAMLALVSLEYVDQRDALLGSLQAQARIVGESSVPALVFDDAGAARGSLDSLRSVEWIRGAALYRADEAGGEPRLFAEYRAAGEDASFARRSLDTTGFAALDVTHAVSVEGREVGYVQVIARPEELLTRVGRYFATVLAVAVGALAIAFALTGGLRQRVRETEHLLQTRAHYDDLTGLPNRNLFNDRIQHAISLAERRSGTVALLFCDLDNFKVINDSLGHAAGDLVLALAAKRLKGAVREADTVCRLGGDEFVAILENCDAPAAGRAAEHMLAALAASYVVDGREISVGSSLGIALYPRDGTDAGQLLRAADTALYSAKSAGKGTFRFFSEALDRQAHERMELESGLRRALAHSEFVLHYQPQVDVASRRLTGAEALLRWASPEHGNVPPARFIPVAEESGLIREIGQWALQEACRQAGAWRARAPGFVIAVNVSARQLNEPGLARAVRATLDLCGLPPNQLELELTESALLTHAHEVNENLRALDALGVNLSLDDFGTGYSSLGYLKRLPIGRLKIDQGFTRHLPDGTDDAAIVEAILALAGAMDMEVVAEGVESEAQFEFLRAAGCDYAQGWLFGKAVPAEEFERLWLTKHAAGHAPAGDERALPGTSN